MSELADVIRQWVVNDYFTPNIKAEVILDTLLTPYIADIVKDQCKINGELHFVTKEMSILESDPDSQETNGNRGTKIDYILADKDYVYLVELKTVSTSIGVKQVNKYTDNLLNKEKTDVLTFGEALGKKLVAIMDGNIAKHSEAELLEILRRKHKKYGYELLEGRYAEQAKELLKKKGWYSTKKYLYTIGQILDYVYEGKEKTREIWGKKLKMIYITPDGRKISPNSAGEKLSKWKLLYVKDDCTSVSLKKSLPMLKKLKEENEKNEKNGDYVELLISILEELYPE